MSVPVAFHCEACGKRWPNPEAEHPRGRDGNVESFRSLVNVSEPRTCSECADKLPSRPEERDRIREWGSYSGIPESVARAAPLREFKDRR